MRFTPVIACAALLFSAQAAFSQCKSYAKRECYPLLEDYESHGRLIHSPVIPGDFTDVHYTFNGGSQYRILVCGSEMPKGVEYQIMDTDRNVIYDSAKDPKSKPWFDFRLESTMQLIVHISVPHGTPEQANDQGCIAVITGIKTYR